MFVLISISQVQRRRPDLRLVISSATLEAAKLRDFFDLSTASAAAQRRAAAAAAAAAAAGGGAAASPRDPSRSPAVITVEGRTHPVQVWCCS
jgi:ATP-dependent RNA helicase DDX35